MERVVNTIDVINGKLAVIVGTHKYLLANCNANVEVIEQSKQVPVLGRGNIIQKRYVSLLITFDHASKSLVDVESISRIEFTGDVLREDGKYITLSFDNCLLVSDLDLTSAGTCTFEVQCPENLIRQLLAL